MVVESSPQPDVEKLVSDAVEEVKREQYENAIAVFERYLPALSEGSEKEKLLAAAAFSYYGVCLAMHRRRYGDAVKYCRLSLRVQPSRAEHYANLAMVYIECDNRGKAVEILDKGLQRSPHDKRLDAIFRIIGRRQEPVVTFLPRDNPINVWLGQKRAARRSKRRR